MFIVTILGSFYYSLNYVTFNTSDEYHSYKSLLPSWEL